MTRRDLALVVDDQGVDIELSNGDLRVDTGLKTAVLISLFSDRRLEDAERLPAGEVSRRGWWPDRQDERHGSLLWTHDRAKVTPSLVADIELEAREALRWLLDEEIAEAVTVTGELVGADRIDLDIQITRGTARRWSTLWDAIEAEDFQIDGLGVRILPG